MATIFLFTFRCLLLSVEPEGIEPATVGLKGPCSARLSYGSMAVSTELESVNDILVPVVYD